MDKEIKHLRNKFFMLSSAISFIVIFVMMVILNVLMNLSYKNELKTASDMLVHTAFSNAADTTSELINIKEMKVNEQGNFVIYRDPTTIKKIVLNGTITCKDKTAEWYSAGGGIFFEHFDKNDGFMKYINKEYKFKDDETKVTIDFTDNSDFYYNGQPIQTDISEVSQKCFYISEVWWASISTSDSIGPDEDVTLMLESVEIHYLDNISIATLDNYAISYRDLGGIYPEGIPDTLNSCSCFYFICDKQGNLIEINNGNITAEFSPEKASELLQSEKNEFIINKKKYKYNVSKNDKFVVHYFISNTHTQQNTRRLILISALSGGGAFIIVLILIYFTSGKAVSPISESYRRQKEFISNASHELKTPITVISATMGLMQKKNGKDRLIDCVFAQTKKMTGLVNEMLSLSRLSSTEKIYSDFSSFDISKTIENAVLYFESRAFEEHRKITADIQPNLFYTGNESKIDELASILTDNALKYSDENSEIKISLNQIKDKIVITFENPCNEFDTDNIPHLFERFYRGDKSHSKKKEGFGLGLSIAKEIIEIHNSKINTDYKDGLVVFTVIL